MIQYRDLTEEELLEIEETIGNSSCTPQNLVSYMTKCYELTDDEALRLLYEYSSYVVQGLWLGSYTEYVASEIVELKAVGSLDQHKR